MDIATLIGLVLGLGAVVGGAALEGLHLNALVQPTAALIVLGGTFGAAFVSFPLPTVLRAFKDVKKLLAGSPKNDDIIADICAFAAKARKNGIIALEQDAKSHKDRFMKKAISLSVDGIDPKEIRELLEIDMSATEEQAKMSAEFFEAAGGYAPTIGIIGAVLGLIHVMSNLSDTSKLGAGIAVAFVATIYGLITANILCLPAATKIKLRIKDEMVRKEMIIAGVVAIQNGENPRFIEERLRSYLGGEGDDKPSAVAEEEAK
ncbi:MotA/TolQ/ExbB proton channel [Desulfobulbus propionicus DSM 2032]|jgi:chemotaxis protein MotA|uniref:MotA/TolQ/ExbB proton channel n=1 Tax=Desulfobulbus propionicus (strain ATCC 33891 / DSM 2032 / VKM B-1956 / 1pr3) TaxID=577650 RepID=A0A7U3YP70_DESPD|nr:flagellar motor protein [Desulfobulbus propionicus]ADW19019.1 MotA/TolQ/ExbB proton channel [Desulfobulbus propionicus DSM 2032]